MSVEVLISAMRQKDLSIAALSKCKTDVLIINQTDYDGYDEEAIDGHIIRMISTTQRGLSNSRNMALRNAKGDICIFADDDEELTEGYATIIEQAFVRNPEADIIAFNWRDLHPRASKKYITKERRSSPYHFFSSVSLAFKRQRIIETETWFDSRFGAGSGIINAGEETVWQQNAIRHGLKRFECPQFIATVSQSESTWFKSYNENYFYDIGANLAVTRPTLKYLLQFYYPLRLRKSETISFKEQVKWMMRGMKGIMENLSYNLYKEKYDL